MKILFFLLLLLPAIRAYGVTCAGAVKGEMQSPASSAAALNGFLSELFINHEVQEANFVRLENAVDQAIASKSISASNALETFILPQEAAKDHALAVYRQTVIKHEGIRKSELPLISQNLKRLIARKNKENLEKFDAFVETKDPLRQILRETATEMARGSAAGDFASILKIFWHQLPTQQAGLEDLNSIIARKHPGLTIDEDILTAFPDFKKHLMEALIEASPQDWLEELGGTLTTVNNPELIELFPLWLDRVDTDHMGTFIHGLMGIHLWKNIDWLDAVIKKMDDTGRAEFVLAIKPLYGPVTGNNEKQNIVRGMRLFIAQANQKNLFQVISQMSAYIAPELADDILKMADEKNLQNYIQYHRPLTPEMVEWLIQNHGSIEMLKDLINNHFATYDAIDSVQHLNLILDRKRDDLTLLVITKVFRNFNLAYPIPNTFDAEQMQRFSTNLSALAEKVLSNISSREMLDAFADDVLNGQHYSKNLLILWLKKARPENINHLIDIFGRATNSYQQKKAVIQVLKHSLIFKTQHERLNYLEHNL